MQSSYKVCRCANNEFIPSNFFLLNLDEIFRIYQKVSNLLWTIKFILFFIAGKVSTAATKRRSMEHIMSTTIKYCSRIMVMGFLTQIACYALQTKCLIQIQNWRKLYANVDMMFFQNCEDTRLITKGRDVWGRLCNTKSARYLFLSV